MIEIMCQTCGTKQQMKAASFSRDGLRLAVIIPDGWKIVGIAEVFVAECPACVMETAG